MKLLYQHCLGCSTTSQAGRNLVVKKKGPVKHLYSQTSPSCVQRSLNLVWSSLLDSRLISRINIISDQEAQCCVYCPQEN